MTALIAPVSTQFDGGRSPRYDPAAAHVAHNPVAATSSTPTYEDFFHEH
ncbi:hypothetical protein [Corticibacter populi]|nr:hypothetical protein [Corticibacter populi]